MVKKIFLTSPEAYAGKTVVALGLALKAIEEGARVCYMKPIGLARTTVDGKPMDEDVVLMKKVLNLPHPYEVLCPILVDDYFVDKLVKLKDRGMEEIVKACSQIQKDCDYLLLGGFKSVKSGLVAGLSAPEIARKIDANILLVTKASSEDVVDELLVEKSFIESVGARLQGAVLNFTPHHLYYHFKEDIVPLLEEKGIRVYGVVREVPSLLNPTIREIVAYLNGEVLTAPDKIDSTYETILIGAMGCESALIYARRAANKLVIVGGDRVDIILSTLETPTIAMILTGGIHPGSRVLAKAEEKGVPIILVNYDTYTTVQMISRLSGRIKPEDVKRISMVKELISRDVDYKAIMED
ncbi:MAG: phosphotransacetylase family protein [Candidatus Nezhaarchaeales archaeon]